MMRFKTIAAVAAISFLTMGASAASAAVTYNQTIPTYFGSGNPSNGWTLSTDNGVELGLRGKVYQGAVPTPTGNVYDFALGQTISLEWSFDPDTMPVAPVSVLTITNVETGGTATWDPLAVPDNALNGFGGEQNSWRLTFGILNGAISPFTVGDIDYNSGVDATYLVSWTASATGARSDRVTNSIVLNQGDGFSAAVPEPATWAMMIMGFGGIGATIRSRRRVLATA